MRPLHMSFIVLVLVPFLVFGQGIMEDAIYYDLPDASPCTKWANLTHQFGCATKYNGETGILRFYESVDEIDEVVKLNQRKNEIAVIHGVLFNLDTITKLENFANGILVLENGSVPVDGHSDDLKFPQYDAISSNEPYYEWNPKGSGALYRLYKVPMWLLNANDSLVVHKLALMNKENHTRWSAQLTQFMYTNQDGATCLRLGFCEPVGGHSVWTSLPPIVKKENRFIISTSTIDSISLFHGRSTGAVSDMSGLIANLAALEALSRDDIDMKSFKKQIIFTFFEGENWGYVGSSRFFHDINNFKCKKWSSNKARCITPRYNNLDFRNIQLENIDALVELRQVGTFRNSDNEEKKLYVHRQNHDFDNPIVNLLKQVASNIDHLSLENSYDNTPGLPPSSSKSILKRSNVSLSHNTVVITDHGGPYINKFYHSHFDDYRNVDTKLITKASTLLARSLYSLANDVSYEDSLFIEVNETLIEELTTCLTRNISCHLLSTILPETKKTRIKTPSHYGGPFFSSSMSITSKFVHDFVYLQMNRTRDIDCKNCKVENNQRCIAGHCITSYVHYHEAYSLAFERDYDNGIFKIVNPDEPIWLESYWDPIGLRLYRAGNMTNEAIFVIFSLVVVTISFVLSLLAKRKFFRHFKVL